MTFKEFLAETDTTNYCKRIVRDDWILLRECVKIEYNNYLTKRQREREQIKQSLRSLSHSLQETSDRLERNRRHDKLIRSIDNIGQSIYLNDCVSCQ